MQNIFDLVEHVLEMFCSRWNQSARIVNSEGRVLVKVAGNATTEDILDRIGDRYPDRVRAIIECFGKLDRPIQIHTMMTLFPCMVFIPLPERDCYALIGYYIDISCIDLLENIGRGDHLINGLPKYNLEEQQKMMDEIVMIKGIIERLISWKIVSPLDGQSDVYEVLSFREREILQLVRQGLTNADIAKELYISENTVKSHISRVFKKLGVSRRREIIQL